MEKIKHDIQISSYGGVGTTLFYNFLKEQGFNIPVEGDWGKWKHMRSPPLNSEYRIKSGFKAIYLFSNPMNSIISIFERGFQIWHLERMGQKPHEVHERFTVDEYLKKYKKFAAFRTLKTYLDQGKDFYGYEEHFRNWTRCSKEKRDYPIMIIKYETIWNHLEEIFNFLGMPLSEIFNFPLEKKRNADWQKQTKEIKEKLYNIYGSLYEETKKFPEIKII